MKLLNPGFEPRKRARPFRTVGVATAARRLERAESFHRYGSAERSDINVLYEERTPQDGVIVLVRYHDGYALRHHGQVVWSYTDG